MEMQTESRDAGYRALREQVKAAGLLNPQPLYYWMKFGVALLCGALGLFLGVWLSNPWLLTADAVFLGFASTQLALLAHDVGHRQTCRGRRLNAVVGLVIADGMLAINSKSWMAKHRRHHASPNNVDTDPDVQFPMLVFSDQQIGTRATWLRPAIAFQAFVLPFLFPLQAINMRINGALALFGSKPRFPLAPTAWFTAHLVLYTVFLIHIGSWPMALLFFLVHQGVFGFYNSNVFASNHKGMPMLSEKTDFAVEQVTTSRNLKSGRLIDFLYGGLNFQIEHHLFPTMPRNKLKSAQPIVRRFCDEQHISYHCTGVWQSYREVFSHLHNVSRALRDSRSAPQLS